MRGGEKVLASLCRLFPDATLFTLLHVKGAVAPQIEAHEIRTSFLQHVPGIAQRYRHYLPIFPLAVEGFDLRGFELVISSSHCVAKGVRAPQGVPHLCYCHTPMRYVWDRYDDYFGPGRLGPLARLVVPPVCAGLRAWDVATADRVHRFAANSAYVAGRIRRYYERDALVIPPPVDTEFFTPAADGPGSYDLIVSALAPYKRLDLALEAYRGGGWPLRIVGWGPEEQRLRSLAPAEVSFLGRVDDEQLRELYRGCRALVLPGIEDFGIAPLEAMACGRPAVVLGEGGGAETVEHGTSGLHFHQPSPDGLRAALRTLGATVFDRLALRARAEQHRREVFETRIRAFVDAALADGEPRC